jgi:hypothetical protein
MSDKRSFSLSAMNSRLAQFLTVTAAQDWSSPTMWGDHFLLSYGVSCANCLKAGCV